MSTDPNDSFKEPLQVKSSELTYNDYLKVNELLSLQSPQSEPSHHDEMLFIIIHQAYELWFKLILHELSQAQSCLEKNEVLEAHHFINRSVQIMNLLVQQIHILETMMPVDFLQFRDRLNPASGFQSLQFREVEFFLGLKDQRYLDFFDFRPDLKKVLASRLQQKDLRASLHELLKREGFDLGSDTLPLEEKIKAILPLYQAPRKNYPLYLLIESCLSLDQSLVLWREHHVHVVERIIGFKKGTGGSSGVGYLRSTASKKAFPELWAVRSILDKGT